MPYSLSCARLAVYYLLPHAVQLTIRLNLPCSLLFVATYHIICHAHALQFAICCCMPYSLLFVAACLTVHYLLPHVVQLDFIAAHAIQSAICCHMSYNLLFVTTCCSFCHMPCSLLSVATCRAVCYLSVVARTL